MEIILFNFFAMVRTASPHLTWTFHLITHKGEHRSEILLSTKEVSEGDGSVKSIFALVSCPYSRRFCSGFFTTDRILNAQTTIQNIVRQSNLIVSDVLSEFAKRLRETS